MTLQKSPPEVGDLLPPITRTITREKMDLFEALSGSFVSGDGAAQPPVNIHTDAARAQALGLSRPAASGQMAVAYLHELLARQFGADFRQGGQLSVTFLRPLYGGDTVTAYGKVSGKEQVEHRTRYLLEVWLEGAPGEKTVAGTAEVLVPSPLT